MQATIAVADIPATTRNCGNHGQPGLRWIRFEYWLVVWCVCRCVGVLNSFRRSRHSETSTGPANTDTACQRLQGLPSPTRPANGYRACHHRHGLPTSTGPANIHGPANPRRFCYLVVTRACFWLNGHNSPARGLFSRVVWIYVPCSLLSLRRRIIRLISNVQVETTATSSI